jgi:tetratricopeptide (TPR) repeat protein
VTRALAVALALLMIVPAWSASSAPRKPPVAHDPKLEKLARTHFEAAEKAFNVGRFEEALAEYQQAYDALPLPAFVFNIAQCHRNLANTEQAIFFYQRFLSLDPEAGNRAVVEDLIAEQQRRQQETEAARAPALPQPAAPVELNASPATALAAPAPARVASLPAVNPDKPRPSRISPRWWLFGALGVALLGGVTLLLVRNSGSLPTGRLGSIEGR